MISHEELQLEPNLSYEEIPIRILDYKYQELQSRKIPLLKVLWRNHQVEEVTWEREDDMRKRYLYIFETSQNLGTKFS